MYKDTNYMNNNSHSVFTGFIFKRGSDVGRDTGHARNLPRQYVCSQHFWKTDYTSAEKKHIL